MCPTLPKATQADLLKPPQGLALKESHSVLHDWLQTNLVCPVCILLSTQQTSPTRWQSLATCNVAASSTIGRTGATLPLKIS